jgi:hypothetical protein
MKNKAINWLKKGFKTVLKDGYSKDMDYMFEYAKFLNDEEFEITENTSDGYHTFKELYEFRKMYNATLFNEWAAQGKYDVHKSRKHYDGKSPFGKTSWFIVVAILPTGQITNHYRTTDWTLFKVPIVEKAKFPYDGHTAKDSLNRLNKFINEAYKSKN